jgi:prepilin-type N-terminal cleavage/methylation domain-containing protein
MRRNRRRPSLPGFTLVEVMVVLTLSSVLASLAVPAVRLLKTRARTAVIANDGAARRDIESLKILEISG